MWAIHDEWCKFYGTANFYYRDHAWNRGESRLVTLGDDIGVSKSMLWASVDGVSVTLEPSIVCHGL